ncbi:MAG: ribosome maturation factor RimP [Oscillospiraceae bacterium]|jgi:ribosome maturation factor RimP|nr:ribosome maturation factor RimP [Oscillospiraceae bacterium]
MPALSIVRVFREKMATRSKTAQSAFDLAEPVVTEMGLDLVDVEYKKEGDAYFLRVFVDRKGGISIDECEKISKALDPVFERSLSADPDFFEVSSPGLTRPLKTQRDFERCVGEEIEIKLYQPKDGTKKYTGTISEVTDASIKLVSDDKSTDFVFSEIASAVRVIRF